MKRTMNSEFILLFILFNFALMAKSSWLQILWPTNLSGNGKSYGHEFHIPFGNPTLDCENLPGEVIDVMLLSHGMYWTTVGVYTVLLA